MSDQKYWFSRSCGTEVYEHGRKTDSSVIREVFELTWAELAALEPRVDDRRKEEHDLIYPCLFLDAKRRNAGAEQTCAARIDVDQRHVSEDELRDSLEPYDTVAWTSFRSTPDALRWGIMLRIDGFPTEAQYTKIVEDLVKKIPGASSAQGDLQRPRVWPVNRPGFRRFATHGNPITLPNEADCQPATRHSGSKREIVEQSDCADLSSNQIEKLLEMVPAEADSNRRELWLSLSRLMRFPEANKYRSPISLKSFESLYEAFKARNPDWKETNTWRCVEEQEGKAAAGERLFGAPTLLRRFKEKLGVNQGTTLLDDIADVIWPEARKLETQARAEQARMYENPNTESVSLVGALAGRVYEGFKPTYTDIGNGERFARQHSERARYVEAWKSWVVFDGKRWAPSVKGVLGLSKLTAKSIWTESVSGDDNQEKRNKHAKASEMIKGLRGMIECASAEEGILIKPEQLDADPMVLNVANGSVDLSTGELREHNAEDLLTKISKVVFDPDAVCPQWDSFVSWATRGNVELAEYLQKAVGYSLTGSTEEQVLFFLSGSGGNGKGVFTSLVQSLMGEYSISVAKDLLLARKDDKHPTSMADLKGARLAFCQEVPKESAWDENLLKALTGSDLITARRMHQDNFTFEPSHVFWICANDRPKVRGTDEGIWRRLRLIPFDVRPEKVDTKLAEKLTKELPGILNWAIRGCLAWQRDGLTAPAIVQDETKKYRDEEDLLGRFLSESGYVKPHVAAVGEKGTGVQKGALYAAFVSWLMIEGERHTWSTQEFTAQMKRKGYTEGKTKEANSKRTWHGLREMTAPEVAAKASAEDVAA